VRGGSGAPGAAFFYSHLARDGFKAQQSRVEGFSMKKKATVH
jgi:hypothetical protein